jgi:hypothetical protein
MVTIARRWWRSGGNDQRSYFDASACVADALLAGSTTVTCAGDDVAGSLSVARMR